MADRKTIDIIISTALKATGIDAARRALSSLSSSVKGVAKSIGANLTNIKSAFDLISSGASKMMSAMSKGMEFERMTVQFKSLTGSMELAKSHMADLQDLGRTPPFSLEEFAAASREMLKMTGGMAGFKKEMEIVGDMAAATGNDIATVGRAFGLAYQVIRDGQDFGRAGQQLYSLGIMTKKQVAEFAELAKAGTDNVAVWEKLQEVFGRYKGAMAETEKTTKGVVEAIQGEATVAMTELSKAIAESANPALKSLLEYLRRINEDGTIEEWADDLVDAMKRAAGGIGEVCGALNWMWKSIKTVVGVPAALLSGFMTSKANGGNAKDSRLYALGVAKETYKDIWNPNGDESQKREELRKERADRKKREKEAKAKAAAEEADRREMEDYERGQEEINSRIAAEKAKEAAEAAEKQKQADLKALAELTKARKEAEREIHEIKVANLRDELKASQDRGSALSDRAQYAQTEFDKAFAMYRSEDKGAAQIAEERDYAADYKQLKKDASRYGGKWRIDELASLMAAGDTQGQAAKLEEWRKSKSFTPEVESMVRSAAADQTKTTAEDELRKIANNTENLAKKLDDLLQVK